MTPRGGISHNSIWDLLSVNLEHSALCFKEMFYLASDSENASPTNGNQIAVILFRTHPCLPRPPGKVQRTMAILACSLPGTLLTACPFLRGLEINFPTKPGQLDCMPHPAPHCGCSSFTGILLGKCTRTGTAVVDDDKRNTKCQGTMLGRAFVAKIAITQQVR